MTVASLFLVGMARCAVTARAERAEHARVQRPNTQIAPLNAARTAQRAIPTKGATSGPISQNLFRCGDLLGRTGEIVFEFSGSAGDVNFDGIQAAVLHSQAELFVDFGDGVLLKAITHA
jgi:hypothetical protein